ncbi:MAG: hypothetical protein KDE54_11895, partial [Caldilineaceae bacterium]|nr:hypothetical protein [Caldilineaceae bacterium]
NTQECGDRSSPNVVINVVINVVTDVVIDMMIDMMIAVVIGIWPKDIKVIKTADDCRHLPELKLARLMPQGRLARCTWVT